MSDQKAKQVPSDGADVPKSQRLRAGAPLHYPIDAPQAGGHELRAIADDVLWARIPMPIALNHINVYLLRDNDGWVVVDTGLHHANSYAAWEAIVSAQQLQGLPLKALVCTHYHYDHAGMARHLCGAYGIPLYMTRGEHTTMRNAYRPFPPDGLPEEFVRFYTRAGVPHDTLEAMAQALRKDPYITEPQTDYIRLRENDVLHIGRRQWRVVVGAGHSPEHACLYSTDEAEQPLLIAGDQLISRISSNVPVTPFEPLANPLQDWMESLDKLDKLDAKTWVLPAHQGIFTGLHLRTQELRTHHLHQLDAVETVLREKNGQTLSAMQVMDAIFPKLRNPIDQLLAVGETIAHLHWLISENRACGNIDGTYRYRNNSNQTEIGNMEGKALKGVLRIT